MKTHRTLLLLIVPFLFSFLLLSACGSDSNSTPPVQSGKLTVKHVGTSDGIVISKAVMFNTAGVLVKTATLDQGNAVFDLADLSTGDYFIEVNDMAGDRIPTKIGSTTKNMTQAVGEYLRISNVIVETDTMYLIKTFSKGQNERPLLKYSDGTAITPETYAYAIVYKKESPLRMELRTMDKSTLILQQVASVASMHKFMTWALGATNHGATINNPSPANCQCHGDMEAKQAAWNTITVNKGYCFKCHYGKNGNSDGFVDPTK